MAAWALGKRTMAQPVKSGNPSTTPPATTARPRHCAAVGHGWRLTASNKAAGTAATRAPARVTRVERLNGHPGGGQGQAGPTPLLSGDAFRAAGVPAPRYRS